jgi:hypothetical protein
MSKPLNVVSYGAGVNSTALLVGLHERGERPDLILFSDTGGERPETYEHIRIVNEWLPSVHFPPITTTSYYQSKHATLEQECLNNETLPSKAFGNGGCSVKWKRQPMDKFIEGWQPAIDAWEAGEQVQRLIGIHAGEWRRGKIADCDKYHYVYPLRQWNWGQEDCVAAIERAGLPMPTKSACFFCPAMRKAEVIRLAAENPELFQRAIAMEQNAAENLETVKGLGRNWSWETLVKADSEQQRLDFPDLQAPLCDVCFDGDEPPATTPSPFSVRHHRRGECDCELCEPPRREGV